MCFEEMASLFHCS